MITNIIEIELLPADRVVTRPVHQWDIGQIIKVMDAEIEDGTPVDFGNRFMKGGLRAYVIDNQVTIPAPVLQQERDLTGYVVITDENSETTVKEIAIPVIARPKPEDYVDEEIRESTEFQYVLQAVGEVEANAKAAAEAANRAADSEAVAGNAATAAGNAAVAAAGSANNAAGSATEAAASKEAASKAAGTATEKATEAGNSEAAAKAAKEAAEQAKDDAEAARDEAVEQNEAADGKISAHNVDTVSHEDIRLLISNLTTRLNALANSTDTDLDQMAELVTYIKDNRELIEQITTGKVSVTDIINNLTTNVANKPLSAAQGVALKGLIDALQTSLNSHTGNSTVHITAAERTKWNAKSDFSGSYNDLTNKPTSLKNPNALTINGAVYDGSAAKVVKTPDYIDIPSYWKEHIDGLETSIKEKLDEGGADAFMLLWASDIHGANGYPNSNGAGTSVTKNIGTVAEYTTEKYDIPAVVITGDIHSQASHSAESSVHAEYEAMDEIFTPVPYKKRLFTKGNHDGAFGSPVDGVYYLKNIGGKKIYNYIFRKQALDRNRVFGGDGSYFYVDYPQDVRIIMLNGHTDGDGSTDANGNAVYNSMKNGVYGTEQLKWLAEVALNVPAGTKIIIGIHQQFTVSKDGSLLAGILEAYNKRTTYSGTKNVKDTYWGNGVADTTYTNISVNVDFTEAKGKVVIVIHGHVHYDSIDTTTYSFPVASITTAGADVRDTNPPLRTPSTATETALDIVIISKTAINFIRLGAGSDRVIALDDTVYYSIKNQLTNVKTNNSAGNIVAGNPYSATLTANSGYEISSVVVTMGGTDITSTVYADGVITIAEVTGNVVIAAVAESTGTDEPSTGYTNLFDKTGSGFSQENNTKFYTNWMPYSDSDNDGDATIYHFKGLSHNSGYTNPYKMHFALDSNGTSAGTLMYCTSANKMPVQDADYDSSVKVVQHDSGDNGTWKYVQFEIREALPDNLIITANEKIE